MREELDFRVEARNIAAASDSSVTLPHVHMSTSRALVMDRLDGVPLRGAAQDEGLARTLLRFVLRQVMLTALGAAAGAMAVLLLGSSGGPQVAQDFGLYQVLDYNLLIISVLLGLHVVVTVFRPRA